MAIDALKLIRHGDGLCYVFLLEPPGVWRRTDNKNIIIKASADGDWYCSDTTGDKLGWSATSANRAPAPPQGKWLSRKGEKSYEYDLVHMKETSLTEEYEKQAQHRDWSGMLRQIEATVGPLSGQTILDLGCGAGEVSRLMANLSTSPVGIDSNPEMIAQAAKKTPSGQFLVGDLKNIKWAGKEVDGIWASFIAAYFPGGSLKEAIEHWMSFVRPGGWICLVEINGLFSIHRPINNTSVQAGLLSIDHRLPDYDAFQGANMASILSSIGIQVLSESEWSDCELAFDGPASEATIQSWRARMERPAISGLFQDNFKEPSLAKAAFLQALQSEDHACVTKVKMVIGQKKAIQ